jgi:hypothetical protein
VGGRQLRRTRGFITNFRTPAPTSSGGSHVRNASTIKSGASTTSSSGGSSSSGGAGGRPFAPSTAHVTFKGTVAKEHRHLFAHVSGKK